MCFHQQFSTSTLSCLIYIDRITITAPSKKIFRLWRKTLRCSPQRRIFWVLIGGFQRGKSHPSICSILLQDPVTRQSLRNLKIFIYVPRNRPTMRWNVMIFGHRRCKSGETKPGIWMSGLCGICNCALNERKYVGLKDGGSSKNKLQHIHISKMFRGAFVTAFTAYTSLVASQTITLQAESATLSGVTIATSVPGFTGKSLKQERRTRRQTNLP